MQVAVAGCGGNEGGEGLGPGACSSCIVARGMRRSRCAHFRGSRISVPPRGAVSNKLAYLCEDLCMPCAACVVAKANRAKGEAVQPSIRVKQVPAGQISTEQQLQRVSCYHISQSLMKRSTALTTSSCRRWPWHPS